MGVFRECGWKGWGAGLMMMEGGAKGEHIHVLAGGGVVVVSHGVDEMACMSGTVPKGGEIGSDGAWPVWSMRFRV